MAEQSEEPIVLPAPTPGEANGNIGPERRAQERFPITAAVQVQDLRSQTRLAGRCSDISSSGCYVDTLTPLAVGSLVGVRIDRANHQFEAHGVVAYAHVGMGMGLTFTEIRREDQEVLRGWIAEANGGQPAGRAMFEGSALSEADVSNVNIRMVLNELIGLLTRKRAITESEAEELLQRMYR